MQWKPQRQFKLQGFWVKETTFKWYYTKENVFDAMTDVVNLLRYYYILLL